MSRGRVLWVVVLGGLTAATAVRAQDAGAAGQSIPSSFRSFIAVDDRFKPKVESPKNAEDRDPRDRTHKMHDLVVEYGLNPTVAIFTRTPPTPDAPAAQLAKSLNKVVDAHRANNFGAFVIFLLLDKEFPLDDAYVGGDPAQKFVREDYAKQLRALADALTTPLEPFKLVPFGLAAKKDEQSGAWEIQDETDLLVVLYDRMRVVKRWEFPQGSPPTDEQLQEIVATATKVAAGS